jgi:NADPH-dependent curcumin reductase CurA
MSETATRVVLAHYPDAVLKPADFRVESAPVPAPGEGQFLVRTRYVSVEPMLRLYIDEKPKMQGMPPMPLGTVIPGPAVGEVIASNHPDFAVGEAVEGRFGWQSHALSDGRMVVKVNPVIGDHANALGVAGLPGFTAWCGMVAGNATAGQSWLVSGAGGAVGTVLGPLLRTRGVRAVGIAAGAEKCRHLLASGYAAAADRTAPDFHAQLKAALPDGAAVYFDNVGGTLLVDMLPFLARGAQVLVCGLMATYQDQTPLTDRNYLNELLHAFMFKGLRMQAFAAMGQDAQRPAFEATIGAMLADGRMQPNLVIKDGLASVPQAMVDLFERSTAGKVIVRV